MILFQNNLREISQKINFDTSFIMPICYPSMLKDFNEIDGMYLFVIGMYENGILMKYGRTCRMYRRIFIDHIKDYGNQIKPIFIIDANNSVVAENLFSRAIISKGANRTLSFNGKDRNELFVTSNEFTFTDAKEMMRQICENMKK